MKFLSKLFRIIFNPFFECITSKEINQQNKFVRYIRKHHYLLIIIALILTICITLMTVYIK